MKTSIIIVCFDQLEFTQQCIESVQAFTPEEHEVIFVDNGSTDGTHEWILEQLQKNPNYTGIRNERNMGFPIACNQGIRAATGDYIVLLNNDAVVSKEWLRGLIDCAESSPDIGIVGPRSNFVSGPQLVTDVSEGYDTLFKYQLFAENFRKSFRGAYYPYWRIVLFCALIKRNVINKIGVLDELFSPGSFEDDDFCLRACLAGFRNVICSDVFVHHHGSQSMRGINYKELLETNQRKFDAKWAGLADRSISACMIVRNEAQYIKQCLDSISPQVDEVVVVDTGSTDGTVDIARQYGNVKIYHLDWPDDFSVARNFANSKATKAWILSIDADEILTGLDTIKENLRPFYCYRICTRNYTKNCFFANLTYNKGEYEQEQGYAWFPSTKIRLFPNDKRVVWEFPVHEVVENSVYRLGMGIIETENVIVHHYGRLEETYEREHDEKYYELLKKQWKTCNADLRSLEQLAIQAQSMKKYDEAKGFWFEVLKLEPSSPLAPLNLCHCWAEQGDWKEALKWATKSFVLSPDSMDSAQNLALCEFYAGDVAVAEKLCLDILKKNHLNVVANGLLDTIRNNNSASSIAGTP